MNLHSKKIETIGHNEKYFQMWLWDSNDCNSRVFFMLSQEEEGKIHIYTAEEIPDAVLIKNLESILNQLKNKNGK